MIEEEGDLALVGTGRAPQSPQGREGVTTQAFKEGLLLGTSLPRMACMLAWWMVMPRRCLEGDSLTSELFQELLKATVAGAQRRPRQKGAVFPLREGDLMEFTEVFKKISLQEATSAALVERWQKQAWLFLCMCGLNALNGTPTLPVSGRWTQAERAAASSITSAVDRRLATFVENEALTESAWQKDMKSRQVGYNGEEISTCHELTWDQVIPSLPPEHHGGSINSLDWVGERTREFLLDPTKLLKDPSEISLPKLPGKAHIKSEDRFAIASELVRRNICDWLPLSEVFEVKGQKVLNGLFGVSKPTQLASGQPVLRLIMNLTGSNSTQEQLEGGCSTLPGITAWQSIVVDAGEQIKLFQSDMSSAFYLFRIPKVWQGHLAFNIVVPGSSIGRNPLLDFALVCNVIPMGWLNSVGIMQEISENLVKRGRVSCLGQVLRGVTASLDERYP